MNTVFDSVVGFVKGIFDTQSNVNYNPSAGVEQWRTLAIRALQMTGQYSEANLQRLLYQMQTESGGNPNAINNWDINAVNGTPSKGLMQVIDPTFRAYAMAGYDKIYTIHYLICLHPSGTQCLRMEALRLLIVELGTRMVLEISIFRSITESADVGREMV